MVSGCSGDRRGSRTAWTGLGFPDLGELRRPVIRPVGPPCARHGRGGSRALPDSAFCGPGLDLPLPLCRGETGPPCHGRPSRAP
ncbi:hypothetical protein NDU88_006214 [Pleurodeles waltl]|uniref:Uncharacterized protein n=1 Tax=Pleurodeles waltl TaxID=8319 RepID=A0AAV7RRG5_PLEWA|nr:hypothetical protein NDU88_006214 [Pleurodeles waltl]